MNFNLTFHLINRTDRPDRLLRAIQRIRELGIADQINVINAVTPNEAYRDRHQWITGQAFSNLQKRGPSRQMLVTWGAVACAASHYKCWQTSWTDDYSFHLIFEDDIQFTDKETFKFDLQRALDILKSENDHSDSEITHRSCMAVFNGETLGGENQTEMTRIKEVFKNLHCYLIDSNCARYLVKYCNRFTYQVDIQLGLLARDQCSKQFGFRILNFPKSGTTQDKTFVTDVQPEDTTNDVLTRILNGMPQSICEEIGNYLIPEDDSCCKNTTIPDNNASVMSDYYY
jgi:GR25 family glycosyltransferase involved in LPS biosynthesis